ncbi:unnamed protein product, partial [Symbiodinium sp. KB8]
VQTGSFGKRAVLLATFTVAASVALLFLRRPFTGKPPHVELPKAAPGRRKEDDEEPSEETFWQLLPELLRAARGLPQSHELVAELVEMLENTQEYGKEPAWLTRRGEQLTDLGEWLHDLGPSKRRAWEAVLGISSQRQVLLEKLEELHDLKWDAPFDPEEEAIKERDIAKNAAGME